MGGPSIESNGRHTLGSLAVQVIEKGGIGVGGGFIPVRTAELDVLQVPEQLLEPSFNQTCADTDTGKFEEVHVLTENSYQIDLRVRIHHTGSCPRHEQGQHAASTSIGILKDKCRVWLTVCLFMT